MRCATICCALSLYLCFEGVDLTFCYSFVLYGRLNFFVCLFPQPSDLGAVLGLYLGSPPRHLSFDGVLYQTSFDTPQPGDLRSMVREVANQHPSDQISWANRLSEAAHHRLVHLLVFSRQQRWRPQDFTDLGWNGIHACNSGLLFHSNSFLFITARWVRAPLLNNIVWGTTQNGRVP